MRLTVPKSSPLIIKSICVPIKLLSVETPDRLALIPPVELLTTLAEPEPLSIRPFATKLMVVKFVAFAALI